MTKTTPTRFTNYLLTNTLANKLLFTTVLLAIFFVPLIPAKFHSAVYNLVFTLILIFGTQLISRKRTMSLIYVLVAITMVWIADLLDLDGVKAISKWINVLLFMFIVYDLVKQVSMATEISVKVILEAVNAYLMIGLAFSLMVALTMYFNHDSYNLSNFNFLSEKHESPLQHCVYYAFITMTTTGYGDIIPIAPLSRSLAIFISVTGQLYVAIVIALLIGKYISQQVNNSEMEE